MKHCLKDYRTWLEENDLHGSDEWLETFGTNKSCMAEDGHAGEHMWVPDSEIEVGFLP